MATNEQPEKIVSTDEPAPRAPLSAPPRTGAPDTGEPASQPAVAQEEQTTQSTVEADGFDSDAMSAADTPEEDQPTSTADAITWQAPEYIHHDKGTLWYAVLGGVTLVGAGLAVFFAQWLFAVLIVVMGIALGVLAKRPPRDITYQIDSHGVSVGEKAFPFSQLKAFGVIGDGDIYTVLIRPAKRFMPSVTLYFRHDDGEKIFDALAANLPAEQIKPDMFDKLVKRIRF